MDARTIKDEQRAFDESLPLLLKDHLGQYALFHQGNPAGFFQTRDEAYRRGLEAFGLDDVFLVSEVKQRTSETASLSWELGVMFGQ
jgi:hypothetical protein